MKDLSLSRRAVMLGVAALPMARTAASQTRPKPVVVSSANAFNGGISCCAKAMELIQGGNLWGNSALARTVACCGAWRDPIR